MASLAFCLVENFFIASMLRRAPIVKPGTLICTFSDHTSCPTMQYTFSNSLQWVFLFWWGNVRNAAPLVPIFGVLTGAVKQCWGALKVDSSEYVGAVVPNLHVPALPPGPSASPWAQTPDPCCVCLMSLENSVLFFHKKLFAKARCGAKGSGLGKPGRFERRVGCCEFPSSGCSGCSQASCSHEAERLEAFTIGGVMRCSLVTQTQYLWEAWHRTSWTKSSTPFSFAPSRAPGSSKAFFELRGNAWPWMVKMSSDYEPFKERTVLRVLGPRCFLRAPSTASTEPTLNKTEWLLKPCRLMFWFGDYPLVNIQKAIEHGPIEIVGFTH